MKKNILLVIIVLVLSMSHTVSRAEELILNTEELGSKNESYSSLTDINGIALFSDDMKDIIEEKEHLLTNKKLYLQSVIFTGLEIDSETSELSNESLFSKVPEMNRLNQVTQEKNDYTIVIIIITIIAAYLVFVATNKYYKRKEINENEYDSYLY